MSKSIGNLYTLDDLESKGHSPEAIRYALISGHYRQPLNFTFNGLNAAESALEKLEKEITKLLKDLGHPAHSWENWVKPPEKGFFAPKDSPFSACWAQLSNDMNIPGAMGALFSAMPFDAKSIAEPERFLSGLGAVIYALGVRLFAHTAATSAVVPDDVKLLAEQRWQAKQNKEWATSDTLRDELASKGWVVKDNKEGYELTQA